MKKKKCYKEEVSATSSPAHRQVKSRPRINQWIRIMEVIDDLGKSSLSGKVSSLEQIQGERN